ncbi:hypothetical protein [Oceanospirillum sediminis]|uniref:Uncharacterized protein n=1 Tax=Oceanospirillum sediminis TaxID=2760088 RepID=A0A839IZ53_9GAMM|nr:hypothetical protein [Oceanospirillum sediminis]MBB1489386.1 hypothetical protein [Oceanospirillum sediminis]
MSSMLKPEIHQPSELYDAIVQYYRAQIAAGDSADVVVSGHHDFIPEQAASRQILVEVGSAESGPQKNDGRVCLVFECTLYGVISKAEQDAAYQAMNLATALARHLKHQSWGFSGLAVDDPEQIKLAESFLINGTDKHAGFEAWEVRWQQKVNLGSPQYEDEVVSGIWLAVNPDDPDDINEYREVTDLCLNNSISEQS